MALPLLLLRIAAGPVPATVGFRGLLAFWAGGGGTAEAVEPPVVIGGGGGILPPLRPFPVEGVGYAILPQLEGEAYGFVVVAGAGVASLPGVVGTAVGTAGVAGRSAARLAVKAAAIGDRGQVGAARAV